MNSRKSDPKFMRSYDRGMLRSAFVSLFWGIIVERKKRIGLTLLTLAKMLGTNKGEVSRWFNGDPNWTVNTIANLANALDVDIQIQAIDRATGEIYTPAGLQVSAQPNVPLTEPVKTKSVGVMDGPINFINLAGTAQQQSDVKSSRFLYSEAA